MRRKIFSVFLIVFLLIMQTGFAASAAKQNKDTKKVNNVTAGAATAPVGQLTQLRWAAHTDAATGAKKVRLVFDVTGPVTVQSELGAEPTPRIKVNVKGAVPGKLEKSVALDGKIADSVSVAAADNGTAIIVELPLMVNEDDYKVFTLPNDAANNKPFRVVIDINQPLPPPDFNFTAGLADKVIAIDPGHGGSDPGAIGLARSQEKTVNLAVALKVKSLLEKAGATVLITRETDKDVYGPSASDVDELKARVTGANVKKADIFLSIHANSFVNRTVGGTATYYYQKTRYDAMLARNIQAGIMQNINLQNRGYSPANYYVIKRTLMPAVLVEMAFISNPDEEKLLNDPAFQQKVAQGIVQGMERFFEQAAGGDR